ncbi:hypothetical protein QC764_303680 [Podospora pseudoanserina]|uniref:Uncharacterized protein n=1 Tax=Podospora pseudoanserina TaxID=2609844 RepID=A0ABR0ICS6_9PEZI|nr:hypothetical protein QC764_303680 [Podospora pseudoanserina]
MQAYTLPTRSYRRDDNTTASEPPLDLQTPSSDSYYSNRRSTTPLPFIRHHRNRRRLNQTIRNAGSSQENRPDNKENNPSNLPSYYSTYSLPRKPSPSPPPTERVRSPYRHRTFSFESPPASPELVVYANKGGLDLSCASPRDDLARHGISHAQIRSASSTYPSDERAQSPVSPPLTLGRKILSSLAGYGFSEADFDADASSEREDDDGVEEGLYPGEKRLSREEGEIARVISAAKSSPPGVQSQVWGGAVFKFPAPPEEGEKEEDEGFALPAPESPLLVGLAVEDRMEQEGADEDASTRCLPRVSTAFSGFEGEHSSFVPPLQEEEQEHISFGMQLRERISGHFRRGNGNDHHHHHRRHHRHHHHHYKSGGSRAGGGSCGKGLERFKEESSKTNVGTDVKRWFVRGLKAGRKGVRRVKRGLNHHGDGDKGREGKMKREMRRVDEKLERERGKLRKKPRREGKGKKREGLRGRIWGLLV